MDDQFFDSDSEVPRLFGRWQEKIPRRQRQRRHRHSLVESKTAPHELQKTCLNEAGCLTTTMSATSLYDGFDQSKDEPGRIKSSPSIFKPDHAWTVTVDKTFLQVVDPCEPSMHRVSSAPGKLESSGFDFADSLSCSSLSGPHADIPSAASTASSLRAHELSGSDDESEEQKQDLHDGTWHVEFEAKVADALATMVPPRNDSLEMSDDTSRHNEGNMERQCSKTSNTLDTENAIEPKKLSKTAKRNQRKRSLKQEKTSGNIAKSSPFGCEAPPTNGPDNPAVEKRSTSPSESQAGHNSSTASTSDAHGSKEVRGKREEHVPSTSKAESEVEKKVLSSKRKGQKEDASPVAPNVSTKINRRESSSKFATERREQLLKKAMEVFGGAGPCAVSNDEASELSSRVCKQVGVLTPDQLAKHNFKSKRPLVSVHGNIFDVSNNPEKYGPNGSHRYRHSVGKDITWSLLSGSDSHDNHNLFVDVFKAREDILCQRLLPVLCRTLMEFEREHGKSVGRLSVFDDEANLPPPPMNDISECLLQ